MSETTHTPTPWEVRAAIRASGDEAGDIAITPAADKRVIAEVFWRTGEDRYEPVAANAALIVRAVNCHAELVSICQAIASIGDSPMGTVCELERIQADARAALAKAAP